MISLLLTQIHRSCGGAVFDCGKLTGIAVGQQAVARFHQGEAVLSDGAAYQNIFLADGKGLIVKGSYNLRHRIPLVVLHHIFHAAQSPGKVHSRRPGRIQIGRSFPETAKKFLSAAKKGYEDAIKDPEGAAEILCKAAPELDKELVVNSQKYMKDQYKAEVDQWGYIDPERWNAFYNWLNKNKLVESEIPENTGFTNDYLE